MWIVSVCVPLRKTLKVTKGEILAAELMRIRPDIPIVLCTGYSETGLIERTKAMGIRAIIMKPILMAKMAKAIREALGDEVGAAIGEVARG